MQVQKIKTILNTEEEILEHFDALADEWPMAKVFINGEEWPLCPIQIDLWASAEIRDAFSGSLGLKIEVIDE